jgi:hypothetical protein
MAAGVALSSVSASAKGRGKRPRPAETPTAAASAQPLTEPPRADGPADCAAWEDGAEAKVDTLVAKALTYTDGTTRKATLALRAAEKTIERVRRHDKRTLDVVSVLATSGAEAAHERAATPDAAGPEGIALAIEGVCVARALAKLDPRKHPRASDALLAMGSPFGGELRPELARRMRALGDALVPACVRAQASTSTFVRALALDHLTAIGRRNPADMMQLEDMDVRLETLRAFGTSRLVEALPVLLLLIGSDRESIRETARESLLAYGGDALHKLREAHLEAFGAPADESLSAKDVASKLFEAQDDMRTRAAHGQLDGALATARAGHLDEACRTLDGLLAQTPKLKRKAEAAPVYIACAERWEVTDQASALAAYRKAAVLDGTGSAGRQGRAQLAYLEGRDLERRGLDARDRFEAALHHNPDHAGAKDALRRLEEVDAQDEQSWSRLKRAAGALTAILALLCVALVTRSVRGRALGT